MTPLPPAVSGDCIEFDSPAGRLAVYHAAPPAPAALPPLLLIHSINAAGSAAEVRPLYEHYRQRRAVWAIDLPGFGRSERSDRAYTPRLMTDALHATVARLRAASGGAPVQALAVSLSTEFLARAAVERPADYDRIALVSPTGFSGRKRRYGPPGSTLGQPWLHRTLSNPRWADSLYRGLTRPGVVRFFLNKTWGSKQIDEAMWAYAVATARQPGARYAPLCFLSAGLFSNDVNTLYEALRLPVWMSHGTRGDFVDYRGVDTVKGRPNWRVSVFEAGALPYFEHPAEFTAQFDGFVAAPFPPPRDTAASS